MGIADILQTLHRYLGAASIAVPAGNEGLGQTLAAVAASRAAIRVHRRKPMQAIIQAAHMLRVHLHDLPTDLQIACLAPRMMTVNAKVSPQQAQHMQYQMALPNEPTRVQVIMAVILKMLEVLQVNTDVTEQALHSLATILFHLTHLLCVR